MELTDAQLEAVREAARDIEYGSVTVNISASAHTLDLIVQNRIKIEKEPDNQKKPKET